MPNGIEPDNHGAEHFDQSNAPGGGGVAGIVEQVFRRFFRITADPEISYSAQRSMTPSSFL